MLLRQRPGLLACFIAYTISYLIQPSHCRAEELLQPNIVLILVDDLGWADLGCYGHAWHRTPQIDALAASGMRFTQAYSPAPICSASRASILSGKAVARLGFEFVTKDEPGLQKLDTPQRLTAPPLTLNLPLAETTIAETLTPLGYQTAFFGKWHVSQHHQRYLGWHPKFGPHAQGFDIATEDYGDHPYAWQHPKRKPANLASGEFPTDTMVQRTADYIRGPHDRPFFLMMSSFYVHTPVKNRCRWLVDQYKHKIPADSPNRNKRLEYAAFVETLDHHVGTVISAIDDAGLKNNTLVVFMSDNGGHPEFCGQAPLRGSKWNLYEGGIRVPMICRWPNRIAERSVSDTAVIGYDLLPTFADAAGSDVVARADNLDGQSLLPVFPLGNHHFDRNLIWHFPYYHPETTFSKAQGSIGINDFAVSQTRPQSALRFGDYKLLHFAEDDRIELYNLKDDQGEQTDLSQSAPTTAALMRQRLASTLQKMNARRAN
ncbi:sulfatase [Stieleria marina]|uniref:Arylsulfatase n=1 Tax=Stieleria marina TaxID=1930275 RepID=A0A517NW51_9BACT|nr:Arylsulfatase [Planctomycetes bacterium K23_9]